MNKVLLTGNLGAAPEVKESKGVTFCRFSLATNERWKDRAGRPQERTDWHQVVAFGGLAKSLRSLEKGAKLGVEGKLRVRRYEKDGETRYAVEVHADEIEFLNRRHRDHEPEPDEARGGEPEEHEPGEPEPYLDDDEIPF